MKHRFLKVLCFILLMFFMINVQAKETIIYSEDVGNNTVEQMQEKWISNNDRVFILKTIMDGEADNIYNYLYYSNLYSDNSAVTTSDPRHLADGEYLKININDLNIDTHLYQDIRLNIDHLGLGLVKTNSLKVYAIDSDGVSHGPFYIDDYNPTGYYKRNGTSETYYRGFDAITNNLNDGSNYTITSLEIIPYGNIPRICDSSKTFAGDWRCQSSSFFVKSIKVVGYTDEDYSNKYANYKNIDENEIRIKAAQRMYDLATIKWQPSIDMSSIRYVNGFKFKYTDESEGILNFLYKKGEFYYGPFYTQGNRVLIEKFYSLLDENKKLPALTDKYYFVSKTDESTGEVKKYYTYENPTDSNITILESDVILQSRNIWGEDCSSSVSYSVSKYIPLTGMYSTAEFIWDRNKTILLGDLRIRPEAESTHSVYEDLYSNYLNNIDGISSALKDSATNAINKRIKSNDKRMWIYSIISNDGETNRILSYTEMNSTATKPAIDSNERLKLFIENIDLQSGKAVELKFKYFIRKDKNETSLDESLNEEKIVANFCTSTSCNRAENITLGEKNDISSTYSTQEVTILYTPEENINKIEIMPYGTSAYSATDGEGKLFRLENVKIKVDGNNYYQVSASMLDSYLDLTKHSDSDLIEIDLVNKINGTMSKTDIDQSIASFLAKEGIYGAYRELRIGDVVVTHSNSSGTHVRMITGNTKVTCLDGTNLTISNSTLDMPRGNCNNKGGTDPYKSYYIRTDINGGTFKATYSNRNYYGGLINSSDYTAPWIPNANYTDLISGDIKGEKRPGESSLYLEDKNINYYINNKNTFMDGYTKDYVPITFNDYLESKVEEPYAVIINANTDSNIKEGIKGSIYSNYPIEKISIFVKNNDTNKEKTIIDYPNNSNTSKESIYVNYYSLYYNLPEEKKDAIQNILGDTDNFEVKVSIAAGENENIEVLSLGTNNIDSPATGIKTYSLLGFILFLAGLLVLYNKNKKNNKFLNK